MVLGAAILIKEEGMDGITAVPEVFARLLSYVRIFAIALSHHLLLDMFGLLGHALTLSVELLIALIHDIRLHVVEFASIGLEGGAKWWKHDRDT